MSEYTTIEYYINHIMCEITKRDVEQVSERLRVLGWEEVVRCRDCKYHELMVVSYLDEPLSVCIAEWCIGAEGDNPLVKPDGFCAWGERIDK